MMRMLPTCMPSDRRHRTPYCDVTGNVSGPGPGAVPSGSGQKWLNGIRFRKAPAGGIDERSHALSGEPEKLAERSYDQIWPNQARAGVPRNIRPGLSSAGSGKSGLYLLSNLRPARWHRKVGAEGITACALEARRGGGRTGACRHPCAGWNARSRVRVLDCQS